MPHVIYIMLKRGGWQFCRPSSFQVHIGMVLLWLDVAAGSGYRKAVMKRRSLIKDDLKLFDNKDDKQGYVIRKAGSSRLYVLFTYHDRRVEKSAGVDDTPANRKRVRTWLDAIMMKLRDGKICFSEVFPDANDTEKSWFAAREQRVHTPKPDEVTIGSYIDRWRQEVLDGYDSEIKKFDYDVILRCWVIPRYAEKTFYELTRLEVQKFIACFKCKIGPRKGQQVSRSRASNIITVLRTIYNDAVDEYHWDLSVDPFRNIKRYLPRTVPKRRQIFMYWEWLQILEHVDTWYRPVFEFMILTGMIHSEIAGLQRTDLTPDNFMVQNSIVRGVACTTLKTQYRQRKLPVTRRVRMILDHVLARSAGSIYVFAGSDGKPYHCNRRLEIMWKRALESAGVPHRPFYSIRHSFAAWSLLIGVNPSRLVRLMGHGSKKMVYDVYGDYVDGLENEYEDILNYFGREFVEVKVRAMRGVLANAVTVGYENAPDDTFGESSGESRGQKSVYPIEYTKQLVAER